MTENRRASPLITVWSHELHAGAAPTQRAASWYRKPLPTFSNAIAAVRRELRSRPNFEISRGRPDLIKIPDTIINSLINTPCCAA
jgi:hypothetical protein